MTTLRIKMKQLMKMILKEEGKLEVMENIKTELEAIEAEKDNKKKSTEEDEEEKISWCWI